MANGLVEVKFDEAKLRRLQMFLRDVPNKMPEAVSRAINRTVKSTRAEIVRKMAGEVNVKQKSIRGKIDLIKATRAHWAAEIGISSRKISLTSFKGTTQTKKGVRYRISAGGVRKLIPSAFIRKIRRTGVRGVLQRMTERRYPLAFKRGPSLGHVFEGARGIARGVTRGASKNLEKNIDSQIKYILGKLK